jgi:hypothetical protein
MRTNLIAAIAAVACLLSAGAAQAQAGLSFKADMLARPDSGDAYWDYVAPTPSATPKIVRHFPAHRAVVARDQKPQG